MVVIFFKHESRLDVGRKINETKNVKHEFYNLRGTMTVIYFTDGALLEDESIRRTLLRIPEVLEIIRKSQNEFIEHDLYLVMNNQEAYLHLNFAQRRHLKNLLQRALFERWCAPRNTKRKKGYDLIVRRQDYMSLNRLRDMFARLAGIENLRVVTIGPGFDDLKYILKDILNVQILNDDVIAQDPHLGWFWSEVRSSIEFHS